MPRRRGAAARGSDGADLADLAAAAPRAGQAPRAPDGIRGGDTGVPSPHNADDSTFYNDKVLRNVIILALFEYFFEFYKVLGVI